MQSRAVLRTSVAALLAVMPIAGFAQADLYIRDTPADSGVQPNPDTGPMWVSADIWVRNSPDPGYSPLPYNAASPPWTPLPHQNPEYRDPKHGLPSYVYVRVRNRGNAPSNGTETLQLYWAKASTGLAWPNSWTDASYGSVCGVNRLLGAEITKPRRNAATASAAERQALRDAYIQIANSSAFGFLNNHSYWTKQQHVHRFSPEHGNPAFLPWHREFLNRLEVLLQEADPRVKLMYWQWTTDPENSTGVNLYTSAFMGNSGRGTGGVGMGAPLSPALEPHPTDVAPANVVRRLSAGMPGAETDATILGRSNYFGPLPAQNFSFEIEDVPNHNRQHGYIGGTGGDMSSPSRSSRDPFFFLLHGKVDELWARWQRADPARFVSTSAYGTAATAPILTSSQRPWNGTSNAGPAIDPWTAGGGYIVSKSSFDRSVVSPPIYDTALLTVPVLAPGQEVILEIPWYPPNPAHYSCLGDMNHFCLLGRVQPGIATPETADINGNVRNNNNLAWKNIQVVDDFAGQMAMMSMLVANDTKSRMRTDVRVRALDDREEAFSGHIEAVYLAVPEAQFRRWGKSRTWRRQFARVEGDKDLPLSARALPKGTVLLRAESSAAALDGITLLPGERFPLHVLFRIRPDYRPTKEPLWFDVVQTAAGERGGVVGGVRAQLDLSALHLIKERSVWRHATDKVPEGWTSIEFDDAKWPESPAPLGFGIEGETTAGIAAGTRSAYFRRRIAVPDPGFIRDLTLRLRADDAAVVYLNGKEVHRSNLSGSALRGDLRVLEPLEGAREKAFIPVRLSPDMLRPGVNVIAIEVHQYDDKRQDLVFDAALTANRIDQDEAPSVSVSGLQALALAGDRTILNVDALDPDGDLQGVRLFVDGKQIASSDSSASAFEWVPRAGSQRLRIVAEDKRGNATAEDIVVVGVANLPPKLRLSARPGERPGTTVLSADVADDDGKVLLVEFFMADSDRFDAKKIPVGRRDAPPYEVVIETPDAEHRLVTAQATDDGGEIAVSSTHLHGKDHRH